MEEREMVEIASKVKDYAYAPYSGFRVGAALLTENDKLYTGVNIENVTFGATNCAERTAVFKAVSEGNKKLKAIAVSSDSEDLTYPCGICRQVLTEFGESDMKIICSNRNGDYKVFKLEELLPEAFTKNQLLK